MTDELPINIPKLEVFNTVELTSPRTLSKSKKHLFDLNKKTFIQFKKIITIYWFRNVIFTYHWISRQKKIETMKKSPPLLSLAQISQYKCNIRFERT